LNVIHLATYETSGGAGLAAGRLSAALSDSGVKSRMIVRYADPRRSRACRIKNQVSRRAWFANALRRIHQDMRKKQLERRQPRGAEIVTHYRGRYRVPAQDVIGTADVVNLHWVAEFLDLQYLFATWPAGVPIVWTLHDMNPFTGACHHSSDCERYQNSCGQCPAINSSADDDFSRAGYNYKEVALRQLPDDALVVVGPSQWISDKARSSALLGRFRHKVIPNGQDLTTYYPAPREEARMRLGLGLKTRYVLVVAAQLTHPPKGLDLLLRALTFIPAEERPQLITVGEGHAKHVDIEVKNLGSIQNEATLRDAYSAADLLVVPSRNENLPTTIIESLACGTPVAAFDVGGISELIEHGETGHLAAAGDPQSLAEGIRDLLGEPRRLREMGISARETAKHKFGMDTMVQRYLSMYEEFLQEKSNPGPQYNP